MKRTITALVAAVAFTAAAQVQIVPDGLPPVGFENEPPHYAYYRYYAAVHSDNVTSATDAVRNFQDSPKFVEAFTSPTLQAHYRALITSQSLAITQMQVDLMTTATEINRLATNQYQNMVELNQYRQEAQP